MQSSEVVLTVPAETSYVSLVRTAASAVCAQADFTLDALDDLKLAVDEACALAIAAAPAGADLAVTFVVLGHTVEVDLVSASATGTPIGTNTFAWTVLTALVDSVETRMTDDGRLGIRLRAHGIESVAS
jgi:serine/threonine-protein kinase RsbW